MLVNGIDLAGLAEEAQRVDLPAPVTGRVVHIDADFLAYQVSAEKADGSDNKTFDDMKHNAGVAIQSIKSMAGATAVHLHLTPSTSNKGGRFEQAMLKEYQGNRQDRERPRYLHIMRDHLQAAYPATSHQNCEADDGMSSAQYAAIARGEEHLSIIATKDKDLNMVPGYHLDWDTGRVTRAETFGTVTLRERPSGQKVLDGYGQKFFWGQMLAGDQADNISGLPKLVGYYLNIFKPTKEIAIALRTVADPDLGPRPIGDRARATLAKRSAGLCGPVLTVDVLAGVHSAKDAFDLVKDAYKRYGEELGFTHWKDGSAVSWQNAFVSEAQLLWMRRNKSDPMDVARWFKEINS